MSKISIKTDFVDGEKLFATQLNNNFLVIQAGINANEENLQEVIDQAIAQLDRELEEITADRGWDWNGGDRVTYYKGNTQAIEDREIINGQLLYNIDTGETALDDNGNRIVTGSGNVVAISSTQPTNEATKDWIKPITINGTETAEEYFKNNNNEWVKILTQPSGDTLPIGAISEFGGENAPTNWLFCNGQAVSRTDYAELFSVIGTIYGDGDGSTTFNVPDFSSRSPMGVGTGTDGTNTETTTLGQEKGEYKHQLTVDEMPAHNHKLGTDINCTGFGTNNALARGTNGSSEVKDAQSYIKNTGGDQAHNTVHPVLGVNYIIKAKQSIGVVGTVSEDITDTNNNAVPNCETVKEYVDKSIINAGSNASINITANVEKQVPLNTEFAKVGTKFSLSNDSIVIGSDVSHVLISAQITFSGSGQTAKSLQIKKNGTTVARALLTCNADLQPTVIVAPKLIEVEEGDLITMVVSNSENNITATASEAYTYINIQEV